MPESDYNLYAVKSMKKKIYLFTGTSRAALYGIGTYMEQMIHILKDSPFDFEVVHLYSESPEIKREEKEGYFQIEIPKVRYMNEKNASRYYARSVAYLLRTMIPEDKNIQYIFHLNFMTNENQVRYLRRLFKCKIVLVGHYTDWSFEFFGDEERLLRLMKKLFPDKTGQRKNGL